MEISILILLEKFKLFRIIATIKMAKTKTLDTEWELQATHFAIFMSKQSVGCNILFRLAVAVDAVDGRYAAVGSGGRREHAL